MYTCEDTCIVNGTNTCCASCASQGICESVCASDPLNCGKSTAAEMPDEETACTVFQQEQLTVIQNMISLLDQKKAIEAREKEMKDQLKAAMERHNIKAFKTDEISIAYVAETVAVSIDSAKVKKKYPQVFEECQKSSKRSAYVKITVKGSDRE